MVVAILEAVAAAVLILCGAEFLSNALAAGLPRLKVRQPVIFLLACAGASLPEVLIPLLAASRIPDIRGDMAAAGAIIGAPLMLSTLALGVTGLSVFVFAIKNKRSMSLSVDAGRFSGGLFMLATAFCTAALLAGAETGIKRVVSPVFIIIYAYYLYRVISGYRGGYDGPADPLHMSAAANPARYMILLQGAAGAAAVAWGASLFVNALSHAAPDRPEAVFIMAALAAPVMTELPEITRGVALAARGGDSAAVDGVMNSLFFQAGVMVSIGVLFTQWQPGEAGRNAALIIAAAAAFTGLITRTFNRVHALMLAPGVLIYGAAVYYLLRSLA